MDSVQKLKSNREFRRVYDTGKSFANKYVVIFFVKNNLDYNRVGVSATKKLGNSVLRNRTKRRIKEVYRLNVDRVKRGYDIIFLTRASAKKTNYKEIESAILHILKVSGLLKKGE